MARLKSIILSISHLFCLIQSMLYTVSHRCKSANISFYLERYISFLSPWGNLMMCWIFKWTSNSLWGKCRCIVLCFCSSGLRDMAFSSLFLNVLSIWVVCPVEQIDHLNMLTKPKVNWCSHLGLLKISF